MSKSTDMPETTVFRVRRLRDIRRRAQKAAVDPSNAPFPEPEELMGDVLDYHPSSMPMPDGALEDLRTALEGDGSPWSYLSASILARELNEFGALWHGCHWSDVRIVAPPPGYCGDDTPPGRESTSWSPPGGPWTWSEDLPSEWNPVVRIRSTDAAGADTRTSNAHDGEIVAEFHTYSPLGTEDITRIQDVYTDGRYDFRPEAVVIAEGMPGGGMMY